MVVGRLQQETEVTVIGAGPGGYVAALRAADLGKEVILIEERDRRGGVCLLEGCIPSKTLIHVVELADAAREARAMGLNFEDVSVDLEALRRWKESVVGGLSSGVDALLKRRGVEVVRGHARFENNHTLAIEGDEHSASEVAAVSFRQCIIATGSRSMEIPHAADLPIWSSTEALSLPAIPERLLVVGGGYIGLELGLVYSGLGSAVTVVEMLPNILLGADPDLVSVLFRSCERRFASILLETKVVGMEKTSAGCAVVVEAGGERKTLEADQVLVAVGRKPNTDRLGLEHTRVVADAKGTIEVSPERRTAEPSIYAIGDVTPGPMLAHKASREAKVAAEVIAGRPAAFDNRAVPAVVFTHPEVAWTGLTELEARAAKVQVKVGRFPLSALGRAKTLGRTEGLVKVLSEPDTGLLLGMGIVGPMASELITEGTLAIEMGATLEDIMVTIHPHPTMSEAIMEAAEAAAGAAVHIHPREKTAPKRTEGQSGSGS